MTDLVISILYALFLIIISIFLLFRLKLGEKKESSGSIYIYSGLTLLFIVSLFNIVQHLPGYPDWFLSGVYSYLTILKAIGMIGGIVLFIIGLVLHFSFFSDRDVELSNHIEKLRLLDNIQQESKYPYPLLELLDKVLKSLFAGLGEEAGAVFLLNRTQHKFILATGVGLTREETALLEYYPYDRNVVTQAIENGEPVISSDFRSLGGKAQLAASRFKAILVLPISSGRNKLGAMLFFSTEERHYSPEFLTILTPIVEWLAEKIEVNRLNRDLGKLKIEIESKSEQLDSVRNRMKKVALFRDGIPSPSEFAERCLDLIDIDEVILVGLVNGQLSVHGASDPLIAFSDNFKSALANAIGKNKAIILNQESTDESGNSFISRSTLLMPADDNGNAILFRKTDKVIEVSRSDLYLLEMAASLAGMVISSTAIGNLSKARSLGLKAIADTLKIRISGNDHEKVIDRFSDIIESLVKENGQLIIFERHDDIFKLVGAGKIGSSERAVSLQMGEGSIGQAAALKNENVIFGSGDIDENLTTLNTDAENSLRQFFGDNLVPTFQGDYPIVIKRATEYVCTVFMAANSHNLNMEYHNLFTLLTNLLNLRIEIVAARDERKVPVESESGGEISSEQINEINNNLSAIMGYCQLTRRNPDLPGEAEKSLDFIISSIEKMTDTIRALHPSRPDIIPVQRQINSAEIIDEFLKSNLIYGNLYKIGERALGINLQLQEISLNGYSTEEFRKIFDLTCQEFAHFIDEEEVLTVRSYHLQDCVYIDFSKHRDNFPPIEQVSGFGQYMNYEKSTLKFQDNELISALNKYGIELAFDRQSRIPSFLSYRLQPDIRLDDQAITQDTESLTILAVDDQTVILDLLSAMCQSLGYDIYTARDGEEGFRLFENYRPDIVITDLAMPNISGWELASKIKAISSKTPIILITGWGVTVDEARMKEIGVDHVLHKPFRLEQLSELISQIKLSMV